MIVGLTAALRSRALSINKRLLMNVFDKSKLITEETNRERGENDLSLLRINWPIVG